MKKAWKICEFENGDFKVLFHGINGTRTISSTNWIHAEIKDGVRDGTSKTTYTSGLHVIEDFEECKEYLEKFTNRLHKLCMVEVAYDGKVWEKTHSRSNVLLVEKIKITGKPVMYNELFENQ